MSKPGATAGVSILMVEDDDLFRDTFIDAMNLQGIRVEGFRTGGEAMQALDGVRPSVIMIDVQLPDVHGFDLCRRIKRSDRLKKIPVVFLSAATHYNDPRDRAEGLLAGASLFLSKPISMERLSTEIGLLI